MRAASLGPEARDVGAVGAAAARGPAPPVLPVPLGERGVGREVGQRLSFAGAEPLEAFLAVETSEQRLQRLLLEAEDRVPIDVPIAVQRRSRVGQALAHVGGQARPPRQLLDAQEQRIAIAAARRVIGARLDRGDRRRRGQRIDHQHVAAEAARPAGEPREIRQIADSPARARARRVELGRESPGAKVVGQVAASRADHQQRLAAAARIQAVVAERQLLRQRAVQRARAAVLQHEVGRPPSSARSPPGSRTRTASGSSSGGAAVSGSTPMAACSAARVARDKSCFTPRAS